MGICPVDLPVDPAAIVEKPDTTEKLDILELTPAASTQSNVASEEEMDTSFRPAQSKRDKRKVKLSRAWSVDVHLHVQPNF
jgi:hypothetical protein